MSNKYTEAISGDTVLFLKDGIAMTVEETLMELNNSEDVRKEIKEHKQSFNIRRKSDMRAIKLWQEATGKDMVCLDHADLSVWLLGLLDKHGICPKCEDLFEGCFDSPHASCGCEDTGSSEWYELTPHMKKMSRLRGDKEVAITTLHNLFSLCDQSDGETVPTNEPPEMTNARRVLEIYKEKL